jgi:GTP diphosphokinase / guanosine-3',5'-bis(diphosphate) 3'-diphosphatase
MAVKAHQSQKRKGSGAPYVLHPLSVTERIARATALPAGANLRTLLLAAVLHDVLEDSETPPSHIEAEFGPEVLGVVRELTQDMSLPKPERRKLMIEHCGTMSLEARVVKLADRLDNLTSMHLLDEEFQERYSREAGEMIRRMAGTWPEAEAEIARILRPDPA